MLADEIKKHVEIAQDVGAPNPYQEKLIDMPTFNGQPIHENPAEYTPEYTPAKAQGASGPDTLADIPPDELPPEERNPFLDEMPSWMMAEYEARNTEGGSRKVEVGSQKSEDAPETAPRVSRFGPGEKEATDSARGIAPNPQPPRSPEHSSTRSASNGRRQPRLLRITFTRTGDLERDKYRLKEIVDRVRNPKGRDRFVLVMESNGQRVRLAFPNDPCTVSERLVKELRSHFRVDVSVENGH